MPITPSSLGVRHPTHTITKVSRRTLYQIGWGRFDVLTRRDDISHGLPHLSGGAPDEGPQRCRMGTGAEHDYAHRSRLSDAWRHSTHHTRSWSERTRTR